MTMRMALGDGEPVAVANDRHRRRTQMNFVLRTARSKRATECKLPAMPAARAF